MITPNMWVNFIDIMLNEKKPNIKVKLQWDSTYIKLINRLNQSLVLEIITVICGIKGRGSWLRWNI